MSTAPHDDVRGRWLSGPHQRLHALPHLRARGVATIEVAVVIAVTLVMAALALSAYRTYAVRREVSASLSGLAPIQEAVEKAFEASGVPPASELDVPGLPHPKPLHRFIPAVAIKHGRIELRFGDDADAALRGRSVHLTPFETADSKIVWLCGDGPAEVGLYPLGFAAGTNRTADTATTVEPRYLPAECR